MNQSEDDEAKRARSVGKGSEPTSKVPRAAIGNGGEIHQVGGGDVPILTTQQGIPVSDDQNSLRVGARGPAALEDFAFREKIFHFDHERIPERVVHARGFGAHGYFENYESLADITRADVFARAGKKTPAFVRFSTVAGVPVRRVGRLVLDRCVENFFAETEQVAFCTQNIVPGVDFSNDPLLQGRNFSYLDTQLKRLGSPNFTFLPINAPKCPFHTMQQDGHMAMVNPRGRVNYEPNSWAGALGGPREAPDKGFRSFPVAERGSKDRVRSETFADHYSQARQFYISQTDVEQAHIASAFTFELSKVQTVAIRSRMVGHLLNIEEGLAHTVAGGLRLREMPQLRRLDQRARI